QTKQRDILHMLPVKPKRRNKNKQAQQKNKKSEKNEKNQQNQTRQERHQHHTRISTHGCNRRRRRSNGLRLVNRTTQQPAGTESSAEGVIELRLFQLRP